MLMVFKLITLSIQKLRYNENEHVERYVIVRFWLANAFKRKGDNTEYNLSI